MLKFDIIKIFAWPTKYGRNPTEQQKLEHREEIMKNHAERKDALYILSNIPMQGVILPNSSSSSGKTIVLHVEVHDGELDNNEQKELKELVEDLRNELQTPVQVYYLPK